VKEVIGALSGISMFEDVLRVQERKSWKKGLEGRICLLEFLGSEDGRVLFSSH
jgi:hypothetical protein